MSENDSADDELGGTGEGEGEGDKDDDGGEKSIGITDSELSVDTYSDIKPLLEPGESIRRVLDCHRVQVMAVLIVVRRSHRQARTRCGDEARCI